MGPNVHQKGSTQESCEMKIGRRKVDSIFLTRGKKGKKEDYPKHVFIKLSSLNLRVLYFSFLSSHLFAFNLFNFISG